jgi:hypothetical protein
VFAIDAVSFVVSAFFLLQLQVRVHTRPEPSRFMLQLRDGFREVASRTWVRAPIIGFAISNFCLAAFIVLGPRIFLDHFDGARDWGIVSSCGAIGGIVGGLSSVRFRARHPLSAGFFACMLIAVPIAALAGPLPVLAIAGAWMLGLGSVALCNVWWDTTLQRGIPESVYARVRSYDILVSFVFMPLGYVVFPLIGHAVGYEWTLLAAALVTAATNLVVAFVPGVHAVTEQPVTARAAPTPV